MTEDDLTRLRARISDYSGWDPASQRDDALAWAVAQRRAALRLAETDAYWPLLQQQDELDRLVHLLTNKETYFFREERQFAALRDHVLPELLAAGRRRLRVWSAGCATGEEAYSLAITLLEYRAQRGPFAFEVIGTDLDAHALEAARRGCYDRRAVRRLPPLLRARYLIAQGPHFCVVPALRDPVRFVVHNLAQERTPPFLTDLDVIFCRNVTIYFSEEARDRLNARLAAALRKGGYLFVASAETMGHDRGCLELVPLGETFAFRKERPPVRPALPQPPPRLHMPPPPAAQREQAMHAGAHRSGRREGDQGGQVPPDPAATLERAHRAFQRQDYQAALRELDHLPADSSAPPEADLLRAATFLQQSRLEEAEAICRRLLTRDRWQAEAHLLLGLIRRQQDQIEAAVRSLKRAIYLQPTHRHAHFFLAETYRELGAAQAARSEYDNTLNILRRGGRTPRLNLVGLEDEMLQRACLANLSRLRAGQQGFMSNAEQT